MGFSSPLLLQVSPILQVSSTLPDEAWPLPSSLLSAPLVIFLGVMGSSPLTTSLPLLLTFVLVLPPRSRPVPSWLPPRWGSFRRSGSSRTGSPRPSSVTLGSSRLLVSLLLSSPLAGAVFSLFPFSWLHDSGVGAESTAPMEVSPKESSAGAAFSSVISRSTSGGSSSSSSSSELAVSAFASPPDVTGGSSVFTSVFGVAFSASATSGVGPLLPVPGAVGTPEDGSADLGARCTPSTIS